MSRPSRPSVAAGALVLGAVLAVTAQAPATAAPGAPAPHGLDGFAGSRERVAELLAGGLAAPRPQRSAVRAATDQPAPTAGLDRMGTLDAPRARVAAADDCATLGLDWTLSHEPVTRLRWAGGTAPWTVSRQREGGALTVLGSTSAPRFDVGISPYAYTTYTLTDAAGLSCTTPGLTMSTPDGAGLAEAVTGSAANGSPSFLRYQDEYSLSEVTAGSLTGVDPSFSSDGRQVASTREQGDRWVLETGLVSRGPDRVVGAAGTVSIGAEWSPDGTRVAYTRYTVDPATGDVTGSALRILDARTGTDAEVAGSAGLAQPDWVTGTRLVAASLDPSAPMSFLPAAGGSPTAIPGTAGGSEPEVGRQLGGQIIWFVTDDGTTSTMQAVLTYSHDQVVLWHSSTTLVYSQPRVSEARQMNGDRLFVTVVDTAGTRTDPSDNTFFVGEDLGSGQPQPTAIGAARDATADEDLWGYDVRRPLVKGTGQLAGDPNGDLLAQDSSGRLYVYPATDSALLGSRVAVGSGFGIYDTTYVPGDLDGDDRADLLSRDAAGVLWRYPSRGHGGFGARVRLGGGWKGYTFVDAGDLDGDGRADLVARDTTGYLWFYPGTGSGGFGARTRIGSGWNSMDAIVGSGDFDLDGAADLLAREKATGYLWLYPGSNGRSTGAFAPRRRVGSGWGQFTTITSPGIVGINPLVYAKTASGQILVFVGTGDGRFDNSATGVVGSGFGPYRVTS